jgi:hypothetical protein
LFESGLTGEAREGGIPGGGGRFVVGVDCSGSMMKIKAEVVALVTAVVLEAYNDGRLCSVFTHDDKVRNVDLTDLDYQTERSRPLYIARQILWVWGNGGNNFTRALSEGAARIADDPDADLLFITDGLDYDPIFRTYGSREGGPDQQSTNRQNGPRLSEIFDPANPAKGQIHYMFLIEWGGWSNQWFDRSHLGYNADCAEAALNSRQYDYQRQSDRFTDRDEALIRKEIDLIRDRASKMPLDPTDAELRESARQTINPFLAPFVASRGGFIGADEIQSFNSAKSLFQIVH